MGDEKACKATWVVHVGKILGTPWLFREPLEISETGSDIYYLGNKAYIGKRGYIASKEFRTISVT